MAKKHNPFSVFRRNQKAWMAGLTLFTMFSFIALGSMLQCVGQRNQGMGPQFVGEIAKTQKFGTLDYNEFLGLRQEMIRLESFLNYLTSAAQELQAMPSAELSALRMQVNYASTDAEALVTRWLVLKYAEAEKLVPNDDAVVEYLQLLTRFVRFDDKGGATNDHFGNDVINNARASAGLSIKMLSDLIKKQIAYERMIRKYDGGNRMASLYAQMGLAQMGYGHGPIPISPSEKLSAYAALNRMAKAKVAVFKASDYVSEVADPTDDQARAFYEQYKDIVYRTNSKEPGFTQPQLLALEIVRADVDEALLDSITDEEVKAFYEEHKEEFRIPRPAVPEIEEEDEAPTQEAVTLEGSDASLNLLPLDGLDLLDEDEAVPAEEVLVDEAPVQEIPADETPVEEAPAEEAVVEEAPAEETPAEEVPAEETPAVEAPAEEVPVEEAPADEAAFNYQAADSLIAYQQEVEPIAEAPVEEVPAEETPAEEAVVVEAPVEEAPAEETPAEEVPAEETPAEEAVVAEAPVGETPVEEAPAVETPAEEVPTEEAPVEEAVVAEAPVEETPVEETPVDELLIDDFPIEDFPVEEAAEEEDPDFLPLSYVEGLIRSRIASERLEAQMAQLHKDLQAEFRARTIEETEVSGVDMAQFAADNNLQYHITSGGDEAGNEAAIMVAQETAALAELLPADELDRIYASAPLPFSPQRVGRYDSSDPQQSWQPPTTFYVYRVTESKPQTRLEYEDQETKGVNEETKAIVVESYKMQKAAEIAKAKADEFATKAQEAGADFDALAAGANATVVETEKFSWFRSSFGAYGAYAQPSEIREVGVEVGSADRDNKELVAPGWDFYETVFGLEQGGVGSCLNQIEDRAFVVKVTEMDPEDQIRDNFDSIDADQSVAFVTMWFNRISLDKFHEDFVKQLQKKAGFEWIWIPRLDDQR
ncbi:MAG: hypothetical protein PHO46_10100 [Thermoguttaceae bacterium]|jgi:hypothetical protein|nr:hypothetical protein [Thermoguttaceae bacterium]